MALEKLVISRRNLLGRASVLALGMFLQPSAYATRDRKFTSSPFKLGIASGDPVTDGFVLWTRISTNPLSIELPLESYLVEWEISESKTFKTLVASGVSNAHPEHAHSVHVEVIGLRPDRVYFYRFRCGGFISDIGKTRTLPVVGSKVESFRFAYASCQDISNGYFAAYRDMVEQDPKLIIHTGDYIYEGVYRNGGRRIPVPEAISLEDYRLLYARYKSDPDLQAAHAAAPWLLIWDDHEVENDWGGNYSESEQNTEAFLKRKTAALKAYYENMPIRLSARTIRKESRIYSRTYVGDLLEFNLLDCRQYRDKPPCLDDKGIAPRMIDRSCSEAQNPERSMLGFEQEKWLRRGLGHLGQRWNTLVQTTYMSPFDYLSGDGVQYKTDGWDGYAANRQRLLDLISTKGLKNVVSLGGEIHAAYAGVVHERAFDFDSKPLISELICTSLSSGGGGQERYENTHKLFSENPFARYFDCRFRGYSLCDVNYNEWVSKIRASSNVRDPNASFDTREVLTINSGEVKVYTKT